jgi:hypothetical protein
MKIWTSRHSPEAPFSTYLLHQHPLHPNHCHPRTETFSKSNYLKDIKLSIKSIAFN